MNMSFGLILVIIGFFMPIVYDSNGIEIANNFFNNDKLFFFGILTYGILISAVMGIIIEFISNKKGDTSIDWMTIITSLTCGLIVYFSQLKDGSELLYGAYIILIGWIMAFIPTIIFKIKKYIV